MQPRSAMARKEPECIDEDLHRSEQQARRRAIQDAKGYAAQERQAEVGDGLAIRRLGKLSLGHGLDKPRAYFLRE